MALQIEVSKVSVTDSGPVYSGARLSVVMNLKCWTEGDNTETDPTVIDQNFTGEYSAASWLTVQQRIDKTVVEMQEKMQVVINAYKRELVLLSNTLLNTAVTTIQTNLVG